MLGRRGFSLACHISELASRLDGASPDETADEGAALDRLEVAVNRVLQRKAEDEATDLRRRIAIGQVTQGIVIVDERGEDVLRNAPAERLVGARHGEALIEAALGGLLAKALRGDRCEETLDLWGPPRKTMYLKAIPLLEDGCKLGAMGTVEDVTERCRLESVRRDFMANVSHELKTPVGAISLLAEAIADENDDEVRERLVLRIQKEAGRLARIVDDLLDLSRIESDEANVKQFVAVRDLVCETVDNNRSLAEESSLPLSASDVEPHLMVKGDPVLLVSALNNLVTNAVRYSDAGSPIRVEAKAVNDMVEIAVIDRGIGIPSSEVERIFERFYRVDRARSRDTGGTGLGLSIVRHIASNHGGDVRVISCEGYGSTFTLTLPLENRGHSGPHDRAERSLCQDLSQNSEENPNG